MSDPQTGDREQIIDHIHSIFSAFLRRDREALRGAHTDDWVGFLGPSSRIERGIEAYMKNAELSLQNFQGKGYELLDTEVQINGDVALVFYVARYDCTDTDGHDTSIPLRSVDVYRREAGGWIHSGSHIAVIPSSGDWGEGDATESKGR
jgi:ketosteroid isomerase-like protein